MTTRFTSSHHHGLSLTSYKSKYMCDGCLMDGHGERYRCNEFCNYDLHKECLNPNPTRSLDLFPGCVFEFLDRPPPGRSCGCGRSCDVCGLTVKGFVYHCKKKGLDVHPLCASLKKEIRVDDVKFKLSKGVPYSKCNWCNHKTLEGSSENVPGFCYVSSKDCSFHVACLMEMGIKYGASSSLGNHSSCSCKNVDDDINVLGQELVIPRELVMTKRKKANGKIMKFGRVVGLFLKIVLSAIFGDPTAILASMVIHLLKP